MAREWKKPGSKWESPAEIKKIKNKNWVFQIFRWSRFSGEQGEPSFEVIQQNNNSGTGWSEDKNQPTEEGEKRTTPTATKKENKTDIYGDQNRQKPKPTTKRKTEIDNTQEPPNIENIFFLKKINNR